MMPLADYHSLIGNSAYFAYCDPYVNDLDVASRQHLEGNLWTTVIFESRHNQ